MNRWSKRSSSRLLTCHEDLIFLFEEVLQVHDCSIICGHRNEADQNKAYDGGFSKLRWPDGNHNAIPSNGIDVSPYVKEVGIDGNNPKHLKYFYHFAGIVLGVAAELYKQGAMAHRIRWGGDWSMDHNMDDQTLVDLFHYEIVK